VSENHSIGIYGRKGKLQSMIDMPLNARVVQISWSRWGKVDEVSFQFGGDGTEDIEIHEGEAETERVVGFTVRPDSIDRDEEEYEEEDEDE